MIHMPNQVRVIDLERPTESYIAFSIDAAKPEHRKGYAMAIAADRTIQIETTTYEPIHASQEEI